MLCGKTENRNRIGILLKYIDFGVNSLFFQIKFKS